MKCALGSIILPAFRQPIIAIISQLSIMATNIAVLAGFLFLYKVRLTIQRLFLHAALQNPLFPLDEYGCGWRKFDIFWQWRWITSAQSEFKMSSRRKKYLTLKECYISLTHVTTLRHYDNEVKENEHNTQCVTAHVQAFLNDPQTKIWWSVDIWTGI